LSGSEIEKPNQSRGGILFIDPIGHLLTTHDREICNGLSAAGYAVSLITNSDHPLCNQTQPYKILPLFGNCVGDRSSLVKGLNYALFFPKFAATVWRSRPEFALIYFSLYPAADRRLVRWLARRGIRTIVCAHDVLPLDDPEASAAVYNSLYSAAWRIIAFSDYAKRELISTLGVSPDKVATLYFGEEWNQPVQDSLDARNAARSLIAVKPDDKIVLCFGQIKKNKDLDQLFAAFAQVLDREPLAKLFVVGRPRCDNFHEYAAKVTALGIEAHVVFRPEHIDERDVETYFQAADLVVIPYTRLYQSAVLPLACRFRKPVVATRVGNIPEVIQDGYSGYLVPPGDADAMASAIVQALADPAEAQRRGQRACETALLKYSWPNFCAGLSQLLQTQK
jgi:glycosyltransferase involved in cell wall biosynthesis